ncbi:MAG: response regulator transcription factor [Saprospiraceae bacterium]
MIDIVQAIMDGLSYKLIADRYGISLDTVRSHIRHIYPALNINSKSELVRKMLEKR